MDATYACILPVDANAEPQGDSQTGFHENSTSPESPATSGLQPVPAACTVNVTTPANAAADVSALSVAQQENHASPDSPKEGRS